MSESEPPPDPPPSPSQRHPDCTADPATCRVSRKHWVQNLIAWEPVYDGNGMMMNSDPNTFISEMSCTTCLRVWQVETLGSTSTVRDMPALDLTKGASP